MSTVARTDKTEALARVEAAGGFDLAVASAEATPAELVEALQETLGGKLRPWDLQRIVWPAGKATTWEIPTAGGETTPAKEIVAVPVLAQTTRLFWEKRDAKRGEDVPPPDCKSDDGETAQPTERGRALGATGVCATCPLAQWGEGNRPPACKERRDLYLLLEGQFFPMVLSVPPSSIKIWRDYIKPLSLQGITPWMAVTRFKLTTETGAGGDPYASLKLEYVGKLPPEQKGRIKEYRETLLATFKAGLEATRAERGGRQVERTGEPPKPHPRQGTKPEFTATGDPTGEEMPIEE
jgi:hypothetical protein